MILCSDKNPCIIYDDANDKKYTHTQYAYVRIQHTAYILREGCGERERAKESSREYANFMIKLMWNERKKYGRRNEMNFGLKMDDIYVFYLTPVSNISVPCARGIWCVYVCVFLYGQLSAWWKNDRSKIRIVNQKTQKKYEERKKNVDRSGRTTENSIGQVNLRKIFCWFSINLDLGNRSTVQCDPQIQYVQSGRDDHSYHILQCFK